MYLKSLPTGPRRMTNPCEGLRGSKHLSASIDEGRVYLRFHLPANSCGFRSCSFLSSAIGAISSPPSSRRSCTMPAAHRPSPLQPVAQNNNPRLRSLPTPLRIEHPEHSPAVALVLEEYPSSALSDQSEADSVLPPKPKSLRNQKKLSLNLSAASSNASSTSLLLPDSPVSVAPSLGLPPSAVASRRRPSVVSLPNAPSSIAHRRDEEGSPTVPYIDGPIQILPGIWIGSEENARDWKSLVKRGIKSILNVAKEVASPYARSVQASLRPAASNPNLSLESAKTEADPTYVPPHEPSGRPAMHYLKLPWSHGQADLVRGGFVDGMAFVDGSIERGDAVLIQ